MRTGGFASVAPGPQGRSRAAPRRAAESAGGAVGGPGKAGAGPAGRPVDKAMGLRCDRQCSGRGRPPARRAIFSGLARRTPCFQSIAMSLPDSKRRTRISRRCSSATTSSIRKSRTWRPGSFPPPVATSRI
ncbi:hypothetical protein L542_1305 [Bordetella bronchiseptica F-1]|nr:hypothetical protein L542_1305 [Bordetella bronchiseptica F-1]